MKPFSKRGAYGAIIAMMAAVAGLYAGGYFVANLRAMSYHNSKEKALAELGKVQEHIMKMRAQGEDGGVQAVRQP